MPLGWNSFCGCDELNSDGNMPGGGAIEWTGGADCRGARGSFCIDGFLWPCASPGDTDLPDPADTCGVRGDEPLEPCCEPARGLTGVGAFGMTGVATATCGEKLDGLRGSPGTATGVGAAARLVAAT
jgi:hypothetical protein